MVVVRQNATVGGKMSQEFYSFDRLKETVGKMTGESAHMVHVTGGAAHRAGVEVYTLVVSLRTARYEGFGTGGSRLEAFRDAVGRVLCQLALG